MGIPERRTVDGFEMQFGVDHLGHWALTALLMPALLRAGRRADRHRDQHRPPHGPRRRPGQPAPRGPLRALAGLRPGEARQLPLRPRAAAAAVAAGARGGEPDRPPRPVEHRPADGQRAGDRAAALSQRFFHGLAGSTGMSPASGALPQLRAATDPAAKGGEFYGPLFVNNGAAGPQADPAPARHGPRDRPALGGLRARDRPEARGPRRRRRSRAVTACHAARPGGRGAAGAAGAGRRSTASTAPR